MIKVRTGVLTEQEAAEFLAVALKTMQTWRYKQNGPRYLEPRPRVIRYLESDLILWLKGEDSSSVEGGDEWTI